MNPVGAITPSFTALPLTRTEGPSPGAPLVTGGAQAAGGTQGGFGPMLDGLISTVDGKEAQSAAFANSVMLGQTGQLHQSVIAMQEASVALSLMVQVRNKLVDSYQELMRMQV